MSSDELLRTLNGLGRPKILLVGDRTPERSPCAFELLRSLEAEVSGVAARTTFREEAARIAHLESLMPWHDALVIRDSGGTCPLGVLRAALHAADLVQLPKIVYPCVTRSLDDYRGATALNFNRVEAEAVTSRAIHNAADALAAGRQLCQRTEAPLVLLTLERDGLLLAERTGFGEFFSTHVGPEHENNAEASLAMLALCLAEHTTAEEAARLASLAAEHEGAPLTRDALRARIQAQPAVVALPVTPLRRAG